MAAAAAGAGDAAIPKTTAATDDDGSSEPGLTGPGHTGAPPEADGTHEYGPVVELSGPCPGDGGDGEERRHVRPELEPTAGKAPCDNAVKDELINNFPVDRISTERFSAGVPGDPEGGGNVSGQAAYHSIPADAQPSAVFLHSFPAPPPVTEAGLSLAEPAEPTTNVTTDRDRGYGALVQSEVAPGPAEEAVTDGTEDRLSVPDGERELELPDHSLRDPSPKRRLLTEKASEENSAMGASGSGDPPLVCVQDLSPGSEVRVSLDHVIDDALVVSFRLGDKVFSGVLMDVSKRFGPYGIPITTFPRRDDRSRPPVSLQPEVNAASAAPKQEDVAVSSLPPPQTWTSKPPPLFQEGAPYPPPLFIRDTYNQALPQPPPRKIKRPKRRYRCEEPTSIMNAIKLRPRQVLCDKCKGVVASAGHREARRGSVDLRGEEASRRRRLADGPISSEVKRLRGDDKGARSADRRPPAGIRVSPAPSSSPRVLRAVAAPASSPSRMHMKLNSKKVLAKGPAADRSKARQVLKKLARSSQTPPHRKSKDQNQNLDHNKALTRAAALQNHNQKVHFTRRLQHLSPAAATPPTELPPRMRLKPQSAASLKSC